MIIHDKCAAFEAEIERLKADNEILLKSLIDIMSYGITQDYDDAKVVYDIAKEAIECTLGDCNCDSLNICSYCRFKSELKG